MIPNLARCATKELDNRILAEVKLIRALEIDDSGKRDHGSNPGFAGSQAERQLASCRVPHDGEFRILKVVLARILHKKLIGRADVRECARPCATLVANAAIFEIGGCESFAGEGRAQMSGVVEIVPGPPEAAMNVDQQCGRLGFTAGQSEIDELVWVRAVAQPQIGWRRLPREDVFSHSSGSRASPQRARGGTGVPR